MGDSYKAFEDWINGMSDGEYVDWLEDTATEAQEEKALNIRQPLDDDEEDDMLAQQGQPMPEPPREIEMPSPQPREIDVYDNRDLPPQVIPARVIIQEGQPPQVQPIKKPNIFRRLFTRQPKPVKIQQPTTEKKPSIYRRILSFSRKKK